MPANPPLELSRVTGIKTGDFSIGFFSAAPKTKISSTARFARFVLPSVAAAECAAFEELTVAGLADVLAVVDHNATSRQHRFCHAFNFHSFIGAVIDVHVMGRSRDGHFFIRIKNHNVSVGSYSNRALAREQA